MNNNIETIFTTARELQAADRSGYLDDACGGDAELRSQVEALLAADMDAGSFLKSVEHDPDATLPQTRLFDNPDIPSENAGQIIGNYKLLQSIGEGGFGTVWMAEQKEPVKRRVALKIIKLGMDTKQVIARFEAERQALAMMDHPNIAKVFDAGSTETGRPFFVMELVKGVPILEYCDREKLDTKSRLNLFTLVCNAIQHAHQKGIIHRDIKPGNVLVTLHDGVPVPKVIDFGIAKATSQELTQKTLFTEHHQMIGTPAYMSPEQAEMSGLDIDTRSDIYSLGVLLYELLTGTTPFAHKELMERGFGEMMRIIREETPHKPSTRLSSLGEAGTKTAEQRHTDIRKLGLVLRGDLDWIVMKCLEKDRTRRYDTANGLAADIVRHLSDEPVVAGPPSAGYKIGKFVKRNRGQVIAGGAIAAMLVLGVVGTSSGMVWALNEKDRADKQATLATASAEAEKEAKIEAEANEQKAMEETIKAERELARATEIKRLITQMLTSVSPKEAMGADISLLKGILDDAADRLSNGEVTDELVAAELHAVVGDVYRRLGLYSQAENHLPVVLEINKRVVGDDNPNTAKSMHNLANLKTLQGRSSEAETLYINALAIFKRVLGDEHPDTLLTMASLASVYTDLGRFAEAESIHFETLEIRTRVFGAEHPSTLGSMNNLARHYRGLGRYGEAEPLFKKCLEIRKRVLGVEHPDTLASMNNMALICKNLNRIDEAEDLYRTTLEIKKTVLGTEHPDTIGAIASLGMLYLDTVRFTEAEPLLLESLEMSRRVLGGEHPSTIDSLTGLASLYLNQGRYAETEPLYKQTLEVNKRLLGDEHYKTLGSFTNLGFLYIQMERFEDAATMFETSLPIKRRVLGRGHPWTGYAMQGLAGAYMQLDRLDEALPLWRELMELQTAAAENPDADAGTLNQMAWILLTHEIEELQDPARALGYAKRACRIQEATGASDLWKYLDTLALAQHHNGDTAAAVATQKRAIDLMPENADPGMADRLAEYEVGLIQSKELDSP